MADSLSDLVARLRAAQPALADVPDDVLTAEVLTQLQARGGPSVGDALDLGATFRTSNEKDAGGAAVVRAPESAWTKAATIGAPGIGERYSFPSVGEVLASDQPLQLLAQFVTGHGRPRSVANADPLGVTAFHEGKGPMPLFMGSTAEVGPAVEEALQGIRAYHGSPHDFDQFALEKIGTGEGAQAYGHGLYFAEGEPVAQQYKKALSSPRLEVGGKPITVTGQDADIAAAWLEEGHSKQASGLTGLNPQTYAREGIEDLIKQREHSAAPGVIDDYRRALTKLNEWEQLGLSVKPGGHMYEVQIKADPAHFLDWDAPLSAQSEQVQQAVQQMREAGVIGEETGAPTTGAELLRSKSVLAPEHNLRRFGVPGVKYLDQGSRAAGEGSRNYVVFDDTLIDILRKYGLVPPLAGAAAAGSRLLPAHDPE